LDFRWVNMRDFDLLYGTAAFDIARSL
jgi:hypothetical protein